MNTKIDFCGLTFENPVTVASGTFGFGAEYGQFYDLSELGGIAVKSVSLEARVGNPPPRGAETPAGMLNSVGLQNPGVKHFLQHSLPSLKKYTTKIIVNIAGSSVAENCELAEIISESSADVIELNISCPNVKKGGVAFGTSAAAAEEIVSEVRRYASKPLIVKLTPNVTDIAEIARAAEASGADGLSLINTLLGMAIDVDSRRPVLHNNVGGLSGAAIKPVAVRMVWQVHNAVNLPIIGLGGIHSGRDAIEFMLAGASLVAVGTASFTDPFAPLRIKTEIERYMKDHNIEDVSSIIGGVIPY